MGQSTFNQQYRLLLWKNFITKIRRPIATLVEIFLPLGVILILAGVRSIQLQFRMDQCHLREKQMDSVGPLPFVRDFLCTFNSTCYTSEQINWNTSTQSDFQTFLSNFSTVYDSFPKVPLTMSVILQWMTSNPSLVQMFTYSFTYISTLLAPALQVTQIASSSNSTISLAQLSVLSTFICGSQVNDMNYFFAALINNAINNSQANSNSGSCLTDFQNYLGNSTYGTRMFNLLAPLYFGKIYYTPVSSFTQELIAKANYSFEILDNLRLASIEWRLNFKNWVGTQLFSNSVADGIRNSAQGCMTPSNSVNAQYCALVYNLLNITGLQSLITTVTTLFGYTESILNCMQLNKFVPLQSAADLDNFSQAQLTTVLGGLVFDPALQYLTKSNATFLNYTIRMPTSRIDSTTNYKVLDRYWTPLPRVNTLNNMKYYTSGFLMIQEAVDRAFIAMVTNNQTVNIGSSVEIMPTPCYVNDQFINFAASLMPFLLVIAWSPTFSILVKTIVYEKEKRLKEFMLIMGLSHLIHWLAWFTIVILITIIPNVLAAVILRFRNILQFSSPGVLLLLLFSYTVSFICQGFMLSVFFNKANIASVVAALLYFLLYVPFVILVNVQDQVTYSIYFASSLISQVAYCNAWNFIAYWEQAMVGAQFNNLFKSTVLNLNFGVGHCIVMLWVDAVIYLLITWYVEAVFPGQFGIPKRWYFFATARYWCPNKGSCSNSEVTPYEMNLQDSRVVTPSGKNEVFEEVSSNLKIGISIQNLTKKFSSMKVPSVDNLNLDFYKSHITAFLGHNGAGKTTTISMLTGIYPPTCGTAYIHGQDIRLDIDNIRKVLGLCPQHNILFDDLTVQDHVYFYGRLKGMSATEIKENLPIIVGDVGLTKKMFTQSKKLSGGMKRKLSVAMAFIGGSKAIFLDEPTAGVDPFARRGIWDLLIKYRGPDKTIVLTTHHMDEADYLSDRIAIISQGKLRCCGSSVFLKRQFGDGYYLILVKNPIALLEEFRENQRSESGENVFQFIRKHIQNAKLVEETRTQWAIVLPLDGLENNGFSDLFRDLDASLEMLNISSYGLSDTSLEEVFLKVADDPSQSDSPADTDQKLVEQLDTLTDNGDLPRPRSRLSLRDRSEFPVIEKNKTEIQEQNVDFDLLTGFTLLNQQLVGLQIKRFHYTKRNIKGLLAELILPILMVIFIVGVLNNINPFTDQPSMVIYPWLMMPKSRGSTLNTFYRQEDSTNIQSNSLTNVYRTDVGESGVRCMNASVFQLPNLQCFSTTGNSWSPNPPSPISMQSPFCDCNATGSQVCSDPTSGGPQYSSRLMASSDLLNNLTGYNISDNLIKNFTGYAQIQYGGFQFLLPNYYGQSCQYMSRLLMWNNLRGSINVSVYNATNFVNYFQQFLVLSGERTSFTRLWINNKGYVAMPAYINVFDNVLLRSLLNSTVDPQNYGITVSSYPFKYTQTDLQSILSTQMFLQVSMANFVILALSLIPASFVIFLIEERVSGSKRQQFVSGINPYVYWISNFFWDIIKYLISALLIVLVFVAFNSQSYIGTKNVGAFIAILCLYGFAVIPHMYPFSFIISTPSTAFVVLAAYNMFVGSITTITTYFLDQLQTSQQTLVPINDALKKVFLIFPQYGLGRGMMDIATKYLQYNISNGQTDYDPFSWDIAGKNLTSFGILFVFWFCVLFLIESGVITRICCGKINIFGPNKNEVNSDEDVNVKLERERVESSLDDGDVLRVVDMTKIYNSSSCTCKRNSNSTDDEKRKLAVNNICFGVKPGECFGLLGVNGAGKTTTFKMLTGEEMVTFGEATINGKSIISDMVGAHKNMGFCPQFDALHALLTCEEELYFYCRIRGIDPLLIKDTVESSFRNLSLSPHAKKSTHSLSGGNKRKLSTAISLIGSPRVIFMDEPTSGMDASARRFLWTTIQKLTNQQRAVVLTSHNMEECEVLCHRLAIMVSGEFQCLGSVQQLKSTFGDDYFVTLRMHSNCDENNDRINIKNIMEKEFQNGVSLKDENFVTLQYRMDPTLYKLHAIFEFFEGIKITGMIIDYSVCQTTLDEIFINFAKKQDISTESANKNRGSFANPGYDNDDPDEIST